MKPLPTLRNFYLALLAIPWLLSEMPVSLRGDHKITDGMNIRNKEIPDFSFYFSSTQQLIYLSGTLDIGIVTEFENLLETYPSSIGLVLESEGGNIYQARGLASIIMNHELDTYSFSHCYSACTIAFIAGKKRYVKQNTKLGFHSYSLEPSFMKSFVSTEHEQIKDLKFFNKQVADGSFVQKIFRLNSNELWIPKLTELLKAGVIHNILPD